MPNRVYCHIGLPKTATTSLQLDYFPYVDNSRFDYLGVKQPRGSYANDSLYESIIKAVNTGDELELVNQRLKARLEKGGKSILISEEMFTVASRETTWQNKLCRLRSVLEGTDYRVLATVREPVSAMFSFYVELYHRFSSEKDGFLELARSNNDFLIYRYEELVRLMVDVFGESNIYFQRFEDVLQGRHDGLERFLEYPEMEEGYSLIGNHNNKSKKDNMIHIPVRLRLGWISKIYNFFGGEGSALARLFKSLLSPLVDRVRSVNFRTVVVPMLDEKERDKLEKELAGSISELSERFGVKY